MANGLSFPTILVAENDDGVRSALVRDLQHLGYFVLAAQDSTEAVEIVRLHSRPIHLMLTDEGLDGRALAATLKQYRPHMLVLFITRYANGEGPDALGAEITVSRVQELLDPPANRPAVARACGASSRGA